MDGGGAHEVTPRTEEQLMACREGRVSFVQRCGA